jgi:hypothetical protein
MTGNMIFNSSSTTETSFEKLTSVKDLYVNQKGGYNFKNLVSAEDIELNDQYEANISVIHFGSLTTVTSFSTFSATEADTDDTIDFNQATELHLTAMARYPSASLTIVTKKGATLAMGVLDDLDTNGLYEATSLTMTGPASFSTSLLTDGTLEFTNVATVSVTDYRGGITVNGGVESFTGTDIVALTVAAAADDLTSLTADFKRDDEPSLSSTATAALEYDASSNNGDLDLSGGLANLGSVTVTGKAGDITISSAPNLTSVTVSADAMDFAMDDNDNLTSVNVTGAKFHDVSITGMADLTSLTLNHTTKLPSTSSTASEKGASLTVYNNASLTSLTVSADDIDALSVYTNAALETVDFTGLADDGSATTATAAVYNNNLKVQLFKNGYDTGTAYTTTDTGAITSNSGIATLKTWLDAVVGAASATAGVYVFVDQIDKYEVQSTLNGAYADTAVPTAPSVTTEATANSNSTSIYSIVAKQAAETTTSGSTIRETQTVVFPRLNNGALAATTALGTAEGITIVVNGLSKTFKNGDVNSGSTVSTVADLVAYVNGDTSFGSDITLTASENGYYRSLQTVNYTQGNGTAGATSLYTGRSNNNRLWYKLGSGVVSGYVTLAASANAQAIAVAVANAISDATHPTTGAFMYNAIANGATIELMNAISKTASYADDITPWAAAIPQVTFVIDAAETSTTIRLDAGATSNLASKDLTGSTSGFFLNTSVNDVKGVAVTVANANKGITRLAAQVVSLNLDGTASGVLGGMGLAASAINPVTNYKAGRTFLTTITSGKGQTSAMLVSNTHFVGGPKASYVAVFADISDTSTSTDQSAAITDRTGWL